MSKAVLKINPIVRNEYVTKLGIEIDVGEETVMLTRQRHRDRSVYMLLETEKGPTQKYFLVLYFCSSKVNTVNVSSEQCCWDDSIEVI